MTRTYTMWSPICNIWQAGQIYRTVKSVDQKVQMINSFCHFVVSKQGETGFEYVFAASTDLTLASIFSRSSSSRFLTWLSFCCSAGSASFWCSLVQGSWSCQLCGMLILALCIFCTRFMQNVVQLNGPSTKIAASLLLAIPKPSPINFSALTLTSLHVDVLMTLIWDSLNNFIFY